MQENPYCEICQDPIEKGRVTCSKECCIKRHQKLGWNPNTFTPKNKEEIEMKIKLEKEHAEKVKKAHLDYVNSHRCDLSDHDKIFNLSDSEVSI